jgi:hypothetical protein
MAAWNQPSLQELVEQAAEQAREANEKRYQQALALADEMKQLYTGDFAAGYEAQIQRAKQQSVSSGMNTLIQSGLGATGGAAGLATAFEQSVGAEARLKMEDLIAQNTAKALQAKIDIISSKEDIYPDYSQLYAASAAQAQQAGTRTSQTYGGSLGTQGGTQYTAERRTPAPANDFSVQTAELAKRSAAAVDPSLWGITSTTTTDDETEEETQAKKLAELYSISQALETARGGTTAMF